MKTINTLILSLLFSSAAFAMIPQGMSHGTVTMKIDSSNAQISVKDISVHEGDRIAIYQQTCEGPKVQLCKKTKVGSAVISRVISEKASEIHIDGAPVNLKEGMTIEKE